MADTASERIPGGVAAPRGFLAAGVSAGIKYKEKKDIALIFSAVPASAAGVFTTNRVKAAPVLLTMSRVAKGSAQAIVANSGNANACNGERGLQDARAMAEETARRLNISPGHVLVASTGVIGQPLPMERVLPGIAAAAAALSRDGGPAAAEAILTTDTEPKEVAVRFTLGEKEVRAGAIAKGSGMIHPELATMLCFVTTDAAVTPKCLQKILRHAVDRSFNMLTVDGDTSTNDTVLILANGMAGNSVIAEENEDYCILRDRITEICVHLARAIARDGEGATKLLEVRVVNAAAEKDARQAARTIARSNLVKAAVFGQDANWGRILCAAGYSGAEFDPEKVDIILNGLPVARNGCPLPFSEEEASRALAAATVEILVDLKAGPFRATAWGCDLTYDYVRINAHYRT
ncbi:MAG: bifunctional glutamate N-acetyltransferase/amino-acid acetyltransferase ArgJ [Desulfotomaculales bacterium]